MISVAVDILLFSLAENDDPCPSILLITRKNEPFAGRYAFPGGFVEDNETLVAAAIRELREETGLVIAEETLELLSVEDAVDRDPRSRVIAHSWMGTVLDRPDVIGGDDAATAQWVLINDLLIDEEESDNTNPIKPDLLAFDHADTLAYALVYLSGVTFEALMHQMKEGFPQ